MRLRGDINSYTASAARNIQNTLMLSAPKISGWEESGTRPERSKKKKRVTQLQYVLIHDLGEVLQQRANADSSQFWKQILCRSMWAFLTPIYDPWPCKLMSARRPLLTQTFKVRWETCLPIPILGYWGLLEEQIVLLKENCPILCNLLSCVGTTKQGVGFVPKSASSRYGERGGGKDVLSSGSWMFHLATPYP